MERNRIILSKKAYILYDKIKKKILKKKFKIGIIGYGIQGRAHALNFRDSGHKVIIANKNDNYKKLAIKDKFIIKSYKELILSSDIVYFLIPDESQKKIFENFYLKNFKTGQTIIFAHGYSLHYKKFKIPKKINVAMLAPRNPGIIIREKFLEGGGSPAFYGIYQDYNLNTEKIIFTLADSMGFAKGGLLKTSIKDETEIDLFIEQFMAPLFYKSVFEALKLLKSKGYNLYAVALELYLSGELGNIRSLQAKNGLYKTLLNNASPTCKFGIAKNYKTIFPKQLKKKMQQVLMKIRKKQFSRELENEVKSNYKTTKIFTDNISNNLVSNIEKKILINNAKN